MVYNYLVYNVTGCRAFSIFSPEVFEQAMQVFKVLSISGTQRLCVSAYYWIGVLSLYYIIICAYDHDIICVCIFFLCVNCYGIFSRNAWLTKVKQVWQ